MLFFLQGLAVGAALILPLGPQNTLVLRQGMFKRYALITATFCVISDALLISAGVMGAVRYYSNRRQSCYLLLGPA